MLTMLDNIEINQQWAHLDAFFNWYETDDFNIYCKGKSTWRKPIGTNHSTSSGNATTRWRSRRVFRAASKGLLTQVNCCCVFWWGAFLAAWYLKKAHPLLAWSPIASSMHEVDQLLGWSPHPSRVEFSAIEVRLTFNSTILQKKKNQHFLEERIYQVVQMEIWFLVRFYLI